MSPAQAILTGAVIIAGAILVTTTISPAAAQQGREGPFYLEHHSNTDANVGVFRVDSSSGKVSYCYLTNSSALVCGKYVD